MSFRFGILCFPGVQQLDLTGPYEVFASARDAQVDLVWKTIDPVRASTGLWLTPDVSFADAPNFDLICVPGGGGINPLLTDEGAPRRTGMRWTCWSGLKQSRSPSGSFVTAT